MDASTIKNTKEFVNEFLDEYLSDGIGAKTKREIDILVMNLLMNYGELGEKSNQELSILLQAPASKIKSLRYEARLKYPPDSNYVKREFLYILTKSQVDFDKRKIIFAIEDDYLRHAIQGQLMAKGMFADSSFNTELVKIDVSSLESVISELYGNEIAENFRDGYNEMRSQLDGNESMASELSNGIIQFAVSTLKALGYELIKSHVGF